MKASSLAAILLVGASVVVFAPAFSQEPPEPQSGQGQRGGRGGGMMGMGMGRGTVGTVTEAAADHYTIKTELGEIYTVHFSVNTRIVKQPAGQPRRAGRGRGRVRATAASAHPRRRSRLPTSRSAT
jgi:hypothetical protein